MASLFTSLGAAFRQWCQQLTKRRLLLKLRKRTTQDSLLLFPIVSLGLAINHARSRLLAIQRFRQPLLFQRQLPRPEHLHQRQLHRRGLQCGNFGRERADQ